MITESPPLLAREREVFARYTDSFTALIADETGAPHDAVEPWVVANALLGVHRALIEYVRRRTVAGELRAEAERARALLKRGLGSTGGQVARRRMISASVSRRSEVRAQE